MGREGRGMSTLDLDDDLDISLRLVREGFVSSGCEYTSHRTARVPGFGLLEEATIQRGRDPDNYVDLLVQIDEDGDLTMWAREVQDGRLAGVQDVVALLGEGA